MKQELGKEVESDPELADFIWNGSDALLLMNHTIDRTNKACLDYIKTTFGGMCIKKLRECHNVLNNQFKGILGKFLKGDALKASCFEPVIIFLSNMFQFKNANKIHDTPAGLTEYI